jgi:NDP-sugar pyrophosphorylase family protein
MDGGAFVVTYGDVLTDLNMRSVIAFHRAKGGLATIVARRLTTTTRFGVLRLDDDLRIRAWEEKPKSEAIVNTGIYVMEPKIFDYIPEG